jgi:hypothetical protein
MMGIPESDLAKWTAAFSAVAPSVALREPVKTYFLHGYVDTHLVEQDLFPPALRPHEARVALEGGQRGVLEVVAATEFDVDESERLREAVGACREQVRPLARVGVDRFRRAVDGGVYLQQGRESAAI